MKANKLKKDNNYIMLDNKNKVRTLENFYVNAEIDNLPKIVEEKKEELVKKLDEFQNKYIEIKVDKFGNEEKKINPYLISTYFFKSINPISSKIPQYSAEKLSIVWDLYMYLIEQVNMHIGTFQPSLTHFAKFAGVSLQTISNYKNCGDEDMMNLCEKIYDECFNGNVSLAQTGQLREKSTITRMKIENQVIEKPQPNVNVNVSAKVDLDEINKRLEEIKKFNVKVVELDKKREK